MLAGLLLVAAVRMFDSAAPDGPDTTERRSVFLLSSAGRDGSGHLGAAMHGQLAGLGVDLHLVATGDPQAGLSVRLDTAAALAEQLGTLAVVWVSTGEPDLAVLYLYDASTGVAYWREILWNGNAVASAEAVALGTRRALQGLLQGHPAGMRALKIPSPGPTAEPPREGAPAPEAPRPARRHRARLMVAYIGTHLAPQAPWQSGATASAGWQSPWGLYLAGGYQALASVRAGDATVALRLRRHPVEAVAGYRAKWRSIEIEGEVAGIVDIVTTRTSTAPEVRAANPTLVEFGAGIRARVGLVLLPWLSLPLGVGTDIFPAASPFVARIPDRTVVLDPRKVRLRVELGLVFRI